MVPSRAGGGLTQQHSSSSSSGVFFQGDSSHLSSSNSFPGPTGQQRSSRDMNNNAVLNSVANSGPSVGASSLVTDANSSLSGGGPHLQRSASINNNNNNESSYLCLPASPMSFSSNNISISGSSVMDGHHNNNHQNQNQSHHQQGGSTATSLPTPQQASSLPMGARLPGSPYLQDPIQKKQRLDIKPEDIMQQILQRQDSLQFQGRNPQIQALFQQQRMRQQQQMLQSIPQLQLAHHMQQQQQQQQMQLRQQQQQMQPTAPAAVAMKRPFDGGVCARRLMQYLYHQRQRPPDNTIAYWRKFVAEYYSPRAKKRWCLSLYENVGHHALGVFPQAAMDAWHCDLCGSKSGRGFEATSEVLPRLNEIKFGSGVIDELLFLDLPRESRSPSGIMMLEYAKAVQESVYEQLRVVREGQLRIIFTQDLKILSWEFCARRHEELLPRRLVAPQVNQLLQVAQKCQNTISESGSEGVSQQDLQTNSNMVLSAGRQLAKSLELQSLNDLGFSKRYVRCLQISEVVNSMKDLIDFCREHKAGPIDGLKNYPRHTSAAKLQMQKMQEMEQLANAQGISTDRNTLNKLMALHPGMNTNQMGNNNNRVGALSGPTQAALALTNYQNLHMRQNSMPNSGVSLQQLEASSSFNNNPTQSPSSSSFQMPGGSSMHSSPHHLPLPHQHQQQRSMSANAMLQQSHNHHSPQTSQGNNNNHHQALQHQMIQQLLQEISSGGPSHSGPTNSNGIGFAGPAQSGGNNNGPPSRSNSFKSASNSEAHQRAPPDLPQNLHLQDDITQEFAENGFFGGDMDSMGYGWKA